MGIRTDNSRTSITTFRRCRLSLVPLLFLLVVAPAHAGSYNAPYLRLQTALELYLQIADEGGWPTVPDGPTIEPGDHGPRVAALARRLHVTGDLESWHQDSSVYDDTLRAAVLRFQARHGLETDALVGRNTLQALNVPVEQRIAQLRINMERCRTLFAEGLTNFLIVNVPAFDATLVRDGKAVMTTKVIVGKSKAETPIFEAEIKSVVINPTWSVPYSIASKELLPKIQQDPGFLARGGYDVFDRDNNRVDPADVDWASLRSNAFPYTLVQRAGKNNELGRIKFIFPNEFDVFIHDTPSKHLFGCDSRAFSHGCIRMDNAVDFAERVLEPEGWSRDDIVAQLETGETLTVPLERPIPVIVTYLTALVDESGTVYFYRDIYGRDEG
jgi:murein L,D-transpeptidase YcbB/YkuD